MLLAVACGPKDTPTVAPEPSPAVEEAPPEDPVAERRLRPEFPGVAHSASIDQIALDPTGSSALSRDSLGGLRLWAALDGSAEPQLVPISGVRSMALLRTPTPDGPDGPNGHFVVFGVEASGGARFVSMRADGHAKDLGALEPFNPIVQVVSLQSEAGGRFAALRKDGSIEVFDAAGTSLSTFDEKGFQPFALRASGDGEHLVALLPIDKVGSENRAELQRLSWSGSSTAPTLARSGVPTIVRSRQPIQPTTLVISPDASEAAIVGRPKGNFWEFDIYSLDAEREPRPIEVQVNQHQQPRMGYVGPHALLLSSNEGTPSLLIDTKTQSVRLRSGIPQDFSHQGAAQDTGPGRQVMGYGGHLFVNDVNARAHRFLGYSATQGASVGISPEGKFVAWAYIQGPIVVEAIDDSGSGRTGASVELDAGPNNVGGNRVRFLDEDHLIVVDSVGEVTLVHWPTQTTIARTGTMSNVRSLHVDPAGGMLVLDRHTNESWVYEVDPQRGFEGPYIIANAWRVGLVRPKPPDERVLWTFESTSNEFRHYTLGQLRSDLTVEASKAMGKPLEPGQAAPLAVDQQGRYYGVRWNGKALELFVERDGKAVVSRPIPSNDINELLPSPSGDRFLAVTNRAGVISVAMHDGTTLETLWSYSTGAFNNDSAWSEDGRYVALAANTGAILLDARTGEPVMSRCGLEFRVTGAPPANAFSTPNQKSICEP